MPVTDVLTWSECFSFLDAIASLEPGSLVGWLVGWLVGELVKNSIIRISRYILTNTDLDQVILTLTFI